MKTLIIFLFLSTVAYGQDAVKVKWSEIPVKVEVQDSIIYNPLSRDSVITLLVLDAYQKGYIEYLVLLKEHKDFMPLLAKLGIYYDYLISKGIKPKL